MSLPKHATNDEELEREEDEERDELEEERELLEVENWQSCGHVPGKQEPVHPNVLQGGQVIPSPASQIWLPHIG
jgi:hypothetical protein